MGSHLRSSDEKRRCDPWRRSDTPAGRLHALEERIADAEAERAHGANPRLAAELAELERQRDELQRIAADPAAAEQRVRATIDAALELERAASVNPPCHAERQSRHLGGRGGRHADCSQIGARTLVAPTWFQNRDEETAQVRAFLDDESLRMLTVAGRGGMGKSTLVCRVLRSLGGVVYLSNAQSQHRVTLPDLYAGLVALLPEEAAARVDAVYRDPRVPVRETMQALAEAFARRRAIVLLDNFEDVVDAGTRITDAALDEAPRAACSCPRMG